MQKLVSLLLVLLIGACAQPTSETTTPATTTPSSTALTSPTTTTTPPPATSPLADQVVPLGSAIFESDSTPPPPTPTAVSVDGVRVNSAPVIPVGVEDNGELEIPGAREVGWYRFGPTPQQSGSAVLAAHIAFNGSDGVFRRLSAVALGAVVTVEYDDGSTTSHIVSEIAQYPKDELPFERIFSKTGDPILILITCGGTFNRSLSAYDDNIVVYATPLEQAPPG